MVTRKPCPRAPQGVAGLFDYRGKRVPVIDLSLLTLGKPAQQRLSTRIVLVHYGEKADLLGLIAQIDKIFWETKAA